MDVVDKLKAELCKFVSTKLGAKYADQLSIMKIVDKYNSHVGTVEGLPVDCITIHNRLLVVRYNQEHHTLEDINRIYNIVNDVIRDNTASVVCIPDDVSIISMSASDFRNLMYRQLEIYKMVSQRPMYMSETWEFDDDSVMSSWRGSPPSSTSAGVSNMMLHGLGYASWRL